MPNYTPTSLELLVGPQDGPSAIAPLRNGGFMIGWRNYTGVFASPYEIRLQRLDADGAQAGESILVASSQDWQGEPAIAELPSGLTVVAWVGYGPDGSGDIRAQLIDPAGAPVGAQFRVNSVTASFQTLPDIASLPSGGFVITWTDFSDAGGSWSEDSNANVKVQRFSSSGAKAGVEQTVNTATESFQGESKVAALKSGGFVVVWQDLSGVGPDGSGNAVKGQLYGSDGKRLGQEFTANTTVADDQRHPDVAGLSDGRFVVVWVDSLDGAVDPNASGIRAQIFSASGAKVGPEIVVDSAAAAARATPEVAAAADGGFVVTWGDSGADGSDSGVFGQVFAADGARVGPGFTVNASTAGPQIDPGVAVLKNGDLAFSWSDNGGSPGYPFTNDDRGGFDIRAQIFSPVSLSGTAADDSLAGTAGRVVIVGLAGADVMSGGLGNDTYLVDNAGDRPTETSATGGTDTVNSSISFILGANLENLRLLGSAGEGIGNGAANHIVGNAMANVLDGRGGADSMYGGAGNDTYKVDNGADRAIETGGQFGGTDTVLSSVSFTLERNVEDLTLVGTAPVSGTGNHLDNRITGNSAANRLDGGRGNNILIGGNGDDTYVVGRGWSDRVVEASPSGGVDTVISFGPRILEANVENLILTGGVTAIGNNLANRITGNEFANRIDGRLGADTMIGLGGDDSYTVDNSGDRVIEQRDGGVDKIVSIVTFTLGDQVEHLTLAGTRAIDGTGNALSNRIAGNPAVNALNGGAGNDELDGGGGSDVMTGATGNDVYRVDNTGDQVVEASSGGSDFVRSYVSFTLPAHVESLALDGSAKINGTGNAAANAIYGNEAANVLDGRGGADRMEGDGGSDTYHVDHASDVIFDSGFGGTDRVYSAVSYTMPHGVEQLVLLGTAVTGRGSGIEDVITGNAVANILFGYTGDDVLDGGAGRDRLYGGHENDRLTGGGGGDGFYFDSALNGTFNVDTIADFSASDDTIFLDRDIFTGIAAEGRIAPSAFRTGTAAADASDRIVYDAASGKIFYDADGSGAGAQVLFAQVTAGTVLTNTDFVAYI